MTGRPASPLVPPDFVSRRYAEALPETDALALQALFALRSGTHALDTVVARWLGGDALTPGRWQLLAVLWSRDQAVPQSEITAALNVSRANVSMLVDGLRKEGHVSVASDPDDKRKVLVALTAAGRSLTDRLLRETALTLRQSLALNDRELHVLIDLMRRILP